MHQTTARLIDVIRPEFIRPALRATKRDAVIRELAGVLATGHAGLDEDTVTEALLDRENQGSTAIGEGIAVPHAKLRAVDTIIACLGRSLKGVDFGSADEKKTHFFFAVISPPDSSGSHLKLLAQFDQLFKCAAFRESLLSANSAEDLYALIVAQDAK